ncbi:MAG: PAS domain S-box protein [bacterium]|nr:PAS domain S-box protein [candidate division KSB1 bacterium]MDH7561464.1 PAS domain S-box protein [bacterium]
MKEGDAPAHLTAATASGHRDELPLLAEDRVIVISPRPDRCQLSAVLGGEVECFADLGGALQAVAREVPTVVLVESATAGGAMEVLRALHAHGQASPPVIVLSDPLLPAAERESLFAMGVEALLPQEAGPQELRTVVEAVVQARRAESRAQGMRRRLRRTQYEYQELIESVNDLIFTLDAEGRFRFLNRQVTALTGFHREDWLGQRLVDLVIADDRADTAHNLEETLQGRAKIFEMRIQCADGQVRYFSANINPIFERGQIAGVAGIARDTTQRKQLEQEIVELKNFNESIIQSMQAGLITLDLENRITSFNPAAEEILGYKAREVTGRPLEEVLPKEDCLKILPNIVGPGHSLWNRELIVPTKSGKPVHIGFSVAPRLDDHNQRVGTIISFRDISEIKRLQAEMIKMDRLASLGVLASGIAHEIKNPLAGIKTMAQSLQEESDADDHRREYLERIVRQVDRLDALLRTFFSFARPQPPVRRPHRLPDIMQEVVALVGQKMRSKGIELVTSYADDLPLVFVDFDQIQQVFLNLLLNAVDAIEERGTVHIAARPVWTTLKAIDRRRGVLPTLLQESLFVEVTVTDSGCGIAPEDLGRVFDPFFTTKPDGTGLGLSIVYRIMNEHGGEIRVESEKGKGTTFTLLIPTEG